MFFNLNTFSEIYCNYKRFIISLRMTAHSIEQICIALMGASGSNPIILSSLMPTLSMLF